MKPLSSRRSGRETLISSGSYCPTEQEIMPRPHCGNKLGSLAASLLNQCLSGRSFDPSPATRTEGPTLIFYKVYRPIPDLKRDTPPQPIFAPQPQNPLAYFISYPFHLTVHLLSFLHHLRPHHQACLNS